MKRKIILYTLILSVILIQITVAIIFYNEYINEKKLQIINNNITNSKTISELSNNSRKEYENAQVFLRRYFATQKKEDLEKYFESLQNISGYLSQYSNFSNEHLDFKKILEKSPESNDQLKKLKQVIDSTQKIYQTKTPDEPAISIDKLDLKYKRQSYQFKIEKKSDTTSKKGLFGRLSDAIKGKQEIKTDTVVVTNSNGTTVDPDEINKELQRVINLANSRYNKKIIEVKQKQINIKQQNLADYDLFDRLLSSSNNLLNAYNKTIDEYKAELQEKYKSQNLKAKNIRKQAILGLMILMLVVSIIIVYYIKQSFDYEKRLQQANKTISANLKFKNRIIGMLSHEMRAPMQIMNIFLDRIGKNTENEKVQGYLNSVKFTNNSLLIQANQILEYSKDLDKEASLNKTEFKLKEFLDTTLNAFQAFAESRKNKLEQTNTIPEDYIANTDSTKIYQLFTNILSNANKFTEQGTIGVKINLVPKDQHSDLLHVRISDTGSGIAEKDLQEIFKPYYRGSISEKVENMGAGLGLSLCKELVELFKGEISASSQPGKGTTIDFKIEIEKIG